MNIRNWLKRSRHELGRNTSAVFGIRSDGGHTWGTGILLDFRGTPIVLTCAHVVQPVVGTVFVTTARESYQADPVYQHAPIVDSVLDWACLIVRDSQLFRGKAFYPASDVVGMPVAQKEAVLSHGFPLGHSSMQIGGRIDLANGVARFRSTTYLSHTLSQAFNKTLGRTQPRVAWNAKDNLDAKTFRRLKANLTPQQRGGWSGGPVALAGDRRLCGQLTHADLYDLWYNPLHVVLQALDKRW
jgi:hypothetical protein